jgi:hypothetical protein
MPLIRLGADTLTGDQVLADLQELGKLTPMLKDIAINRTVVEAFEREAIAFPADAAIDQALLLLRHEQGLVDDGVWGGWLEQSGQDLPAIRVHIAVSLRLQALAEALGLEPIASLYERQAPSLAQLTVSYLCSPFRHAIDEAQALIRHGHTSFEQLHDRLRRELGLPIQFIRQTLPQSAFRSVVLDALSPLNPGDFSEPVEAAGQWHLLRLEDRAIRTLDQELQEQLLRDQIVEWATKQLPDQLEVQ